MMKVSRPCLQGKTFQVRFNQPARHRIEWRWDENSPQWRRPAENRNKERVGATGREIAETDSEIDLDGVPSVAT